MPKFIYFIFISLSQAHCYHGQTLLASDKCGEAIRSLQEAEKCKYFQIRKCRVR